MYMNHIKKNQFRSALDSTIPPVGINRPLAICLEKIAHQQQLLQSVRQVLPTHIAEHALHCVMSGARLLIYTNSAVWASQIRFYQEDILNKLQAAAQLKITRIQVKVMQAVNEARSNRPTRLPSHSTAYAMLKQIDENSQDELDLAMANLAQTLLKRLNRKG
jgi:hypothetical protein